MRFIQHTLAFVLAGSTFVLATASPGTQLKVSHDGFCGDGVTCTGSSFGGCCNADGKCGSTPDYCGKGCQNPFGWCQETEGHVSPDGTCGGSNGYTCKGSKFGDCCSKYQFCGNTAEHCTADNCLASFGECKAVEAPLEKPEKPEARPVVPRGSGSDCSCPKANGTVYKTESGAEFEIECGIDYEGGDIWLHEKGGNGFFTESLQACIDACAKFPGCVDVSWIDQHRPGGACYMKNSLGKKTYAAHVFGARQIKQCDRGCPTATPDVHAPPYTRPYSTQPVTSAKPSASKIESNDYYSVSSKYNSGTYAQASRTSKGYPNSSAPVTSKTSDRASKDALPTGTSDYDSASLTKIITPTIIPSSANPGTSSLASASASASACHHKFHRRQEEPKNTIFKREEIDPDCVPCEGQGGGLPYCGADHTVDNYQFTPKTCRTVYYNLDITNQTLAPDGHERIVLAVNGQMPGPLLEANWGDTVVITVNNKLQDNGTSIHFHGIRQLHNSEHDGVPAITQCPIAPGDSFTYKWTATNYGTSWYHSHYAIQAWEGVIGPMIIHGPTSTSWDVDAGTVMLQDWSHRTADSLYDTVQDAVSGGPRIMDNGLLNGLNTYGVDGAANQTGQRFELDTKFEPGKTYLIRIINAAIQATFKFYIDDHELEVINMDFTNIVPYKTDIVNIQIGQRYMLLVKAKATPGNYWMRADSQSACSGNAQASDIKGIIRYANAPSSAEMPTSTAYNYTGECVDEPLASLIPTAKLDAYKDDSSFAGDVTVAPNSDNLFKWYLSGTSFYSKYEDPTLVRVLANASAPTYSGNLILDLPKMGEWIYIIVQSAIPVNHPIHLHGHDFLILGAGSGKYSNQPLNLKNPPRRDTANMPAAGWLVIAFETDNPGAWLMHCHIGWHTSMGFALQILEGKDQIKDTVKDECALYGTCAKWNQWVEAKGFKQHDSGV